MSLAGVVSKSTFDNKTPPFFDGHSPSYKVYRQDVLLWERLTDLAKGKRAFATIGSLDGEPKAYAKTLSVSILAGDDGVTRVLERLDKAYQLDSEDQLDLDLADFLDFRRDPNMSISAGSLLGWTI